ncbi:MAG: 30S ribosomal protein S13 [Candidatus Pacebacteria bacterium]|nr:30S ribosomal protein S13 [Candidatus Paceibacterota bacterium]
MAIRIAGVNIPNEKRIEIALTYVYGIGLKQSQGILSSLKIDPSTRVKDVKEDDANKIREYIDKNYIVEGDLRRQISGNIKRLKEINSYRGSRHTKRLPARGQRTKTNSRTVRGNKRLTMGSGKNKAAAQKT